MKLEWRSSSLQDLGIFGGKGDNSLTERFCKQSKFYVNWGFGSELLESDENPGGEEETVMDSATRRYDKT
jgi:hypothetical protein